ncbi:LuxR C-terminal-related transcriptional regulator [Nocardioides sp. CER19]|uniref:LuxR C-terminal-related transcriptional regulator n=1 Tax=Nocardioides sp. CER19 TaxID=3038538 RepID=UPI002448128C|nr:LuxR C-terminal-related transcriptional regulator [Nocardioides sp. CER19]MDH2416211.1 LuxR C-terminal-related transcriptional regulator [Nocardioides sp. CER19]
MPIDDLMSQIGGLPAATRHLLLVAACASSANGSDDLRLFLSGMDDQQMAGWVAAESAGLVRLGEPDGVALRWADPGLPAALRDAAPFVDRRKAHLALSDALALRPDRRAWHRAAAQLGPDEEVASQLEESAEVGRRYGGWPAEAQMLERAADLSVDRSVAARRYVLASRAARYAGDSAWVARLGDRAAELADDPSVSLEASVGRGWAMACTLRQTEAVALLTTNAVRAVGAGQLDIAWSALAPAAVAAYYAGRPDLHEQVAAAYDVVRLAETSIDARPQRYWLAASLDPVGAAAEVGAALDAVEDIADLDQLTLNQLGGAAWIIDRSDFALTALRAFLDRQSRAPERGAHALVTATLGSVLLDLARWDEAETSFRDSARIAEANGMEMVRRVSVARLAQLAAGRGDHARTAELANRAVAGLDHDPRLSVAVLARGARGLAALGEGNHDQAYDSLRGVVDDKGAPLHGRQALYVMADLVTAALRTGRPDEAADVAEQLRDRAGQGSVRLRQHVLHATALVAASRGTADARAEAEEAFRRAVDAPDGALWPFERARLQLDLGIWLRRERRKTEARRHLVDAHDAFARIGATPWERTAATELRALGVRGATMGGRLADLTPQQQEIVRLAARGLSNPEIAERLVLSPRTVASHLYRAFPRLGITGRGQLRDVVDEWGTDDEVQ